MNLADFIFHKCIQGCEIIRTNGSNEAFSLDTHQIHVVGHSFGDALRCGAIIKDRIEPGKEQVVFVEHDWPFGVEVIRNLLFVDWIVTFPRQLWALDEKTRDLDFIDAPRFKDLPIDHANLTAPYLGVSPDGVALDYDRSDFAGRWDLQPNPYIVMQPFTRWNKDMKIRGIERYARMFADRGFDTLLVGGGKDPFPKLPPFIRNLIGKLTVPESIWVATNAVAAFGVESWCASLLPMLGKPSVMTCLKSSLDLYGERWQKAWPKIRLVEETDATGIDGAIDSMIQGLN